MGKKRARIPGEPRTSAKNANTDNAKQHAQTLEDDVREQRDVQFALEKKQAERSKRRKTSPPSTLSSEQPDAVKNVPTRANPNKVDPRAVGLQVWKNAAQRRKAQKAELGKEESEEHVEENGVGDVDVKLDRKTSAKIMEEARQQRAEIRAENGNTSDIRKTSKFQSDAVDAAMRQLNAKDADDSEEDDDEKERNVGEPTIRLRDLDLVDDDGKSMADTEYDWKSTVGDDDRDLEFLDGSKVTEADELALGLFNASSGGQNTEQGPTKDGAKQDQSEGQKIMLADIILQKIQEKEEANARAAAIAADPVRAERERKIAEVYGLVGNIMAKYRSGKVPKAFKVIPKVQNWEELIYLTRPDEWSPAAVYVATRVLASNLSGKQVVSYYTDILLPRCLEDISTTKKLNYHLYRALVKAVYKPDAFCKGILFPLCDDGDGGCTLRQATVFASVVAKVSIPMLHSAAALLYMCQLKFSVTTCLLMTALIEKKYALPYRVIDGAVDWFMRMKQDGRPLPVVWHKCLLSFAQRYKMELTREQKECLKLLMRVHTHKLITPEIRRELFSSRNRGDVVDPDANTIAKNIENAAMVE